MKLLLNLLTLLTAALCFDELIQDNKIYTFYHSDQSANHQDAKESCILNNGALVDIHGHDMLDMIASRMKESSFIGAWNGDDYNGACLVLSSNGSITVGNCLAEMGFVCVNEYDQGHCFA